MGFYCGDPRMGNDLVGPLRALRPADDSIKVKSDLEAQAASGFLVCTWSVNQLGDTSGQLVRRCYGPNYARLAAIKKKYDPNNALRLNQNTKPGSPPKA